MQCPRFPCSLFPLYFILSTSCPTIILNDFDIPEENPPNTLATVAYSFCFYSILVISSTSGSFTSQNSVILTLTFHSENFSPCSFILSPCSRLLPGPLLLFLTDEPPPDSILPSLGFPDPKVYHHNYSPQYQ